MTLSSKLQEGTMKFKKGQSGNPAGRPKGSKNKLRNDLVQQILEIADDLKNKGLGLAQTAEDNPKWFFEHFVKGLIPKNIELEGKLTIEDVVSSLGD